MHLSKTINFLWYKIFFGNLAKKKRFQQFFIDWFKERIPLYQGGLHHCEITCCFRLSSRILAQHLLLKCDCKEANNLILSHVNNTVKVLSFYKVLAVSLNANHCVKSVCIRSFPGPYFPAIGQYECEKIGARKTPNMITFHAVGICYVRYCTSLADVLSTEWAFNH